MGIKKFKRVLLVVIIIGFLFVFSWPLIIARFDTSWETKEFFKDFYGLSNWILPALLVLLVGITLFSSQGYKNVQITGSTLKKVFDFIFRLILIAITAIVSWIVLVFIGFSNGSYSMSTYGTPIHRPRIK